MSLGGSKTSGGAAGAHADGGSNGAALAQRTCCRHADLPDGGHHTAAASPDDPDTGEQRGNRCERG